MSPADQPLTTLPQMSLQPGQLDGRTGFTAIGVKGETVLVPSIQIDGRTLVTTGSWLKTASVQDEDLLENETVANPESFLKELQATPLKADLFTFAQRLPDSAARYNYHVDWDNFAVIPITTYADWWEKRIEPSVRRAVRKAAKSGIVVKSVAFDDEFVRGIVNINNETPVRQGKPYWHFQKSFEAVKAEHSTYADRNAFLGAYYEDELAGYIRITYAGRSAHIIQILSKVQHFDKRPMNALLAKAVELCAEMKMSHLVYCNYVYNDPNSSLTEFKKRSGFEKVLVPRYYIPLTTKGKIALGFGLHRGLTHAMPEALVARAVRLRNRWYERKLPKDSV